MKRIILSFLTIILLAVPAFSQSKQTQIKEMTDGELIGTTLLALNKTTKRHERDINILIDSESNTVEKIDKILKILEAHTHIENQNTDAIQRTIGDTLNEINKLEERLSKLEAKQK